MELVNDLELLRKRSQEIDIKDTDLIKEIISALKESIESSDRLFLTANELGYNYRIGAIKFADGIKIMINPAFKKRDKMILFRELDYITGDEYIIPRFTEVDCVYQEKDNKSLKYGEIKSYKLNEGAAIVFCRMMDAIDGLLDQDYGLIILPEFDEASEDEKSEVLSEYAKSFKDLYSNLDSELSNDADEHVKKAWNDAKFIKAVDSGDVELVNEPLSNRKKRKLIRFFKSMGIKRKDMNL